MTVVPTRTCPLCNGAGTVVKQWYCDTTQADVTLMLSCPRCYGRGVVVDKETAA